MQLYNKSTINQLFPNSISPSQCHRHNQFENIPVCKLLVVLHISFITIIRRHTGLQSQRGFAWVCIEQYKMQLYMPVPVFVTYALQYVYSRYICEKGKGGMFLFCTIINLLALTRTRYLMLIYGKNVVQLGSTNRYPLSIRLSTVSQISRPFI